MSTLLEEHAGFISHWGGNFDEYVAEQRANNREMAEQQDRVIREELAEQRAIMRQFMAGQQELTQKVAVLSQQQLKPALESSICVNISGTNSPLQHTSRASSGNVIIVVSPPGPPSEDYDHEEENDFDH